MFEGDGNFLHHFFEIDFDAAAGGAGDDVRFFGIKAEGFQNFTANFHFFGNVVHNGHADCVSNALREESSNSDGGFDGAGQSGTGFRDAEMERWGREGACALRSGKFLISLNHGGHPRAFERHDKVAKTQVFHKFHPTQGGFHESVRRGRAVFRPQIFFEGAGVYADAKGGVFFLGEKDDFFEVGAVEKVAGVDADFVRAVVERSDGEARVEMDVGHQRNLYFFFDERDGFGGIKVRHGHAHQIAAGVFHGFNFGKHGGNVLRFPHGHGLDGNGMLGTQLKGTDCAGAGFASENTHCYKLTFGECCQCRTSLR